MNDHSSTVKRIGFVLLLAAVVTAGLAGIGGAQTGEYTTNETVKLTNDTEPITVSVDWNESITDPANTSAAVVFYNETEYAADPANATIAFEGVIPSDPGNTTEAEFNQTDSGLELGNEYRVTVTGPATVDTASIEDSSGFLGGVVGGGGLEGNGMLVGLGVIGLAVIGTAVYTMRD
ncbi:hypothetical protein [Natrinema salaciae]|uniref:Uncharacterized protein n=1 Tax=Natrinema salaciae TaxID=1186196 RepID=A0A1H9S0G2_9EURY|nr:hypothetical protein [Natrinema salaciae]SER78418.1 hypothetical protein SAMN04489841_4530 [Natrinema salaciae]